MIRRWRLAMPPRWFWVLALAAVALAESFALLLDWIAGMPLHADVQARRGALTFVGAILGFLRAGLPNPAFSLGYQEWLARTPWTPRKPLPLGPTHLTLFDVPVLAALELVAWFLGWPGSIVFPFMIAYSFVYGVAFLVAGAWQAVYGLAFAWGLVTWLAGQWPLTKPFAALAIYPIAYWGIRRSLLVFPWQKGQMKTGIVGLFDTRSRQAAQAPTESCGWPFDQLAPQPERSPALRDAVRHPHGILVGMLVGWWIYVVWSTVPTVSRHDEFRAGMLLIGVAVAIAIARVFVYLIRAMWTISPWGRLWTGRWFIWEFDRVFFAPACALAVGLVGIALQFDWPPRIVCPMTVSAVLMLAINLGPSLRSWILTGSNRLIPYGMNRAQYIRPR